MNDLHSVFNVWVQMKTILTRTSSQVTGYVGTFEFPDYFTLQTQWEKVIDILIDKEYINPRQDAYKLEYVAGVHIILFVEKGKWERRVKSEMAYFVLTPEVTLYPK